ncbi:cilia- and flagella-associated protein 99 isoform X2 [Silurus meridionalis]|uniref:Cilia- and flagella-associated protein 99 n=1 Tax=Silurus meridionalis TaxID=175797 RepID=A0A8T0BB54_SILME|nr:cilia- and flagella-associated protein 99 isoform X2 [Silurus meridionalis]KAF7704358.1 hypothetical protein HF521_021430 [Silurus meridionalis]
MNYKELVREAITLLDMYEPDKQCVNSFMEDSKKNLVNRPSAEQIFITDIVYGCIVHQKLLDTVINVFYDQEGKYFRRSHRNQFAVVTYLAMFHLEDLGLEAFSTIIKSLDRSKMHKFLSLFFNATNLTTWIHGEWCQLYEPSYVESKWIVPLLRWQTQMEDLLEYLEKKTTEGFQLKKFPKKSTEPQEFDLTRPKPRPLPAPELIPQQEKNKPVPASTHRAPKEPQVLEEIKQKNHLKAQKVLNEANTRLYRCANPEKSEKTKNILSQIQQARESELKFDSVFSSGMPSTLKKNTLPTRLNTTAILREGALYNRQLEEELNRLELLMQGASEPSAFLQWQKEMKEKDLQEELVQLECKRLEGKISYEEALLARQRVLKLNQHKALIKKEETTELMCRMKEEKQREQEKLRQKILQEKQKREKLVLEQLNTITACRTAAGLATARNQGEKDIKQKLQEAVRNKGERLVALQKILEMEQQERQKNQSEKNKSKLNDQMAAQNSHKPWEMKTVDWLQLEQSLEKVVQREASRSNTSVLSQKIYK